MLTLQEYTLTVTGEGMTETVFTLEDLKTKFPKVDVTTVIQCNGNRREDFHYLGGINMFLIVSDVILRWQDPCIRSSSLGCWSHWKLHLVWSQTQRCPQVNNIEKVLSSSL